MIVNSKIFENGITLVAAKVDHIQSATILITVKAGSRDESSDIMGVSHFLEHMLFKGTRKYQTPKDVSYLIEGIGGEINASTDREFTQYLIRVPNIYIERALDLLSEMFLYPKLDLEELEKERMVILEELNMIYDQPAERCEQLLCKVVWPNHSLGCEVGGSIESISSIDRKVLFDFMERHYKADKMVISIVSPSKFELLVQKIQKYFSVISTSNSLNNRNEKEIVEFASKQVAFEDREIEQAQVFLGFPGISRLSEFRYSGLVLHSLLSGGMSSRLFLELRENQGLVYDINSYAYSFVNVGMSGIYMGVSPSKLNQAIYSVISEINKIMKKGLFQEELNRAKMYLKGRMNLSFENPQFLANWIASNYLFEGKVLYPDFLSEKIDLVSKKEIEKLVQVAFDVEKMSLAIVAPKNKCDFKIFNDLSLTQIEINF